MIRDCSAYSKIRSLRNSGAIQTIPTVPVRRPLLLGKVNPIRGALDTEAAAKAIMTQRNTPAQVTLVSPAELLFGGKLRYHLSLVDRKLLQECQEISHMRAQALDKSAVTEIEKKGQELPELQSGDSV